LKEEPGGGKSGKEGIFLEEGVAAADWERNSTNEREKGEKIRQGQEMARIYRNL